MLELRTRPGDRTPRRVCFLGLGNPDYGDDAFGIRLAEELSAAGLANVVVAGTTPEKFIGRISEKKFDEVVLLDAVDFGAEPGDLVFLEAPEIKSRFPQISTHKISLALLADLAEANGQTKSWLVGVQPESIKPGAPLSDAVRKTLELAKTVLLHTALQGAPLQTELSCLGTEEHLC